jgi:hypothetical protein
MEMKKEIPMLFSTPMVRAIMKGRKTQTRRTKGLDIVNSSDKDWDFVREYNGFCKFWQIGNALNELSIKCPYGKAGDLIWVRETFGKVPKDFSHSSNSQPFCYKADFSKLQDNEVSREDRFKWKPSIHMPKKATRIWLEITGITVERLQSISESDSIAEGIECQYQPLFSEERYFDYETNTPSDYRDPRSSFFSLWKSINGIDSYKANPWVWVIIFKKISK